MVRKAYHVCLTDEEQRELKAMLRSGHRVARVLTRARILLLANDKRPDDQIADALQIARTTVERIRRRYCQEGLHEVLRERPRAGGQNKKLDGRQEAWLFATACAPPPEGRSVWTMQLLADRMVELGMVEAVSDETVRRALKKMRSSPGNRSNGVSRN